jgi:hypothetical protein
VNPVHCASGCRRKSSDFIRRNIAEKLYCQMKLFIAIPTGARAGHGFARAGDVGFNLFA